MLKGFWCYKVLPLVYDGSLSYYEVICKLVEYLNGLIADMKKCGEDVSAISEEVKVLKVEVDRLDVLYRELSTEVGFYGDRLSGVESGLRSVGERLGELFGDVDSLRESVSELSETVGGISETVGGLSEDIGSINDNISGLAQDIEEISDDVDELSGDVSSVSEKVPFAFGVENGEYGYYEEGSQTLTPFGGGGGVIEFGKKVRASSATPVRIAYSELQANVTYIVTGVRDSHTATDGYGLIAFINSKGQLRTIDYTNITITRSIWYAPSYTEGFEINCYGSAFTICITPMYKLFE